MTGRVGENSGTRYLMWKEGNNRQSDFDDFLSADNKLMLDIHNDMGVAKTRDKCTSG